MSSNRGDSTRDWLLKKLLKAKESLVEQGQELRKLGQQLGEERSRAQDIETQLFAQRDLHQEDLLELHSRIQKLSAGRQYTVIHRSPFGTVVYPVVAVSSANGEVVISIDANGVFNAQEESDEYDDSFETLG